MRAFRVALYLAFCGALAIHGVFIHASIKNAFAGLLRGVALLLRGVCCFAAVRPSWVSAAALLLRVLSSGAAASVLGVSLAASLLLGVSAAAPHLLQVACSVFGSLRAVLACSVGGPRFGVPSGRGYLFGVLLMIAARTLCGLCAASLIGAGGVCCWGCWGPSEGPWAVGRLRGVPACYPRRGRKKSGPFLKSVRTQFSRRFLSSTLNLRRLRAMILRLRRLKKLKIFPIRAHTKESRKKVKKIGST